MQLEIWSKILDCPESLKKSCCQVTLEESAEMALIRNGSEYYSTCHNPASPPHGITSCHHIWRSGSLSNEITLCWGTHKPWLSDMHQRHD